MVSINLLPEEARKHASGRRSGLSAWLVPLATMCIVALVASTMTLRQIQDARSLDDEIHSLTREKEKYHSQVALIAQVEQQRDDLARRVEAARNLDIGRGTYVRELAALAGAIPANVWLTGVTQDSGANTVRIEGRALGPAPVFLLMHGLETSDVFDGISLEFLKKDPDQEQGSTSFVINSRTR